MGDSLTINVNEKFVATSASKRNIFFVSFIARYVIQSRRDGGRRSTNVYDTRPEHASYTRLLVHLANVTYISFLDCRESKYAAPARYSTSHNWFFFAIVSTPETDANFFIRPF